MKRKFTWPAVAATAVVVQFFAATSALAAPKVPKISPKDSPLSPYLAVLGEIALSVGIGVLIIVCIAGVVYAGAGMSGKGKENHTGKGIGMIISSVIAIVILFNMSSFLQSWLNVFS